MFKSLWFLPLIFFLNACDRTAPVGEQPAPKAPNQSTIVDEAKNSELKAALTALLDNHHKNALQAQGQIRKLQTAIKNLTSSPSDDSLALAQKLWLESYNQLTIIALAGDLGFEQPILLGDLSQYSQRIDPYPIQPGFIDYFDVYPQSGLVNDTTVAMTAETLEQQHGIYDASDIALGMQTLGFLLFGEAGTRPVTDLVLPPARNQPNSKTEGAIQLSETPQARRRAYLNLLAQLLTEDLKQFSTRLSPNSILRQRLSTLRPETRKQLWNNAINRRINNLITEWQSAISEEKEFRNPAKVGIATAWCNELQQITRTAHNLSLPKLDNYTRTTTTCQDNQSKDIQILAKDLLTELANQKQ